MNKFVTAFTKLTAWPVQFFCFRTKVYFESKKQKNNRVTGAAIIISNHTALYDFAVMLFVFWRRIIRCQAAEVLFKKKGPLPWFLRALGCIEVNRETHNFSFVGKSEQILDDGGVVCIFPESRLPKPEEERPLEFKPSAVYIALQTGAPIIPVYTNGSYFKRKRARVMIGDKIYARELLSEDLTEKENIANINAIIRKKTIELKDELERRIKNK